MTRYVLGTMRVSGNFNSLMVVDRDVERAVRVLDTALVQGVDGLDTAPIYARGQAERDIGERFPDTPVWTKVGVDVRPPLPVLDYTEDTMVATLDGSCERLRRSSVECVFVHNPPWEVFHDLDWARLHQRLVIDGPAESLGVSVLDPNEIHYTGDIETPLVVMVETGILDKHPELGERVTGAGHKLVLRSLFGGGRTLRAVPAADRPAAIEQRLTELTERYDPWAMVIAPRTPEQLVDHLVALRSQRPKAVVRP